MRRRLMRVVRRPHGLGPCFSTIHERPLRRSGWTMTMPHRCTRQKQRARTASSKNPPTNACGETSGNVVRDSIVQMALKSGVVSGLQLRPRNPLPATGGTDPESVADVKMFAPHAYRRVLERAVAASDYAKLA